MNTTGIPVTRYELDFENVAVAFVSQFIDPPRRKGRVKSVVIGKDAGSATQVQLMLRENAELARQLYDSGVVGFSSLDYELDRFFELADGETLEVRIAVDAGADTDIIVQIVIEG